MLKELGNKGSLASKTFESAALFHLAPDPTTITYLSNRLAAINATPANEMCKPHDKAADMEGAPISAFSESKSTPLNTSELNDELQRIINTSETSESVSSQGSGVNTPTSSDVASSQQTGINTPTASNVASSQRSGANTPTASDAPSSQRSGVNTPTASESTSSQRTGINTPTASESTSSQRTGINTPTVSEAPSTGYSGANTGTKSTAAPSRQSGQNKPRASQAATPPRVHPTQQPPILSSQPQTFPLRISLTKGDNRGRGRTVESAIIMMDANLSTVEEVATTLRSHFIVSRARNWDPEFHKCTRIRAAFSSQADKTTTESNQDIMALTDQNTAALLSGLQRSACNHVSLDAWIVEREWKGWI